MEDIIYNAPSQNDYSQGPSSALTLAPADHHGSLMLDYFDLPSPPSTPMDPTHFSSLNGSLGFGGSGGPPSPGLSTSSISTSSTTSSGPPNHWPTASQRISRLPIRPGSRSGSSHSRSSSTSSAGSSALLEAGMEGLSVSDSAVTPVIQRARRTPYYPPNSSRNRDAERGRVFMNRGPHYVPNWTPMGSLPRHVQLQIEERMVRFTAI